jgi:amidohydrolase
MQIDKEVRGLKDQIIHYRRYLHRYPEISFEETNTRDYILEQLGRCGFDEIRVLAQNGVKAIMKVRDAKRTFAFRADMDALSTKEETGVEFASLNQGVMHACGHDGHMAILLGFAQWLRQHRGYLKDNVVLIFQPAEETVGGALPMIEEGVLDNPKVDVIFGFHLFPNIPQGKIGIRPGPVMAQTCEIDIELTGKSGHGAMPHKGIDALLASCYFMNALQGLLTHQFDPLEKFLVNFGKMRAGELRNIIADKATMEGIIRTFDEGVYKRIIKQIEGLLAGLETSYGTIGKYIIKTYYPTVYNDEELTNWLLKLLLPDAVVDAGQLMIADDFSYYQQSVPGVYMFLGCGNEQKGFTAPLHNSKFNFDEEALLYGVQMYVNILKS